ncbi:MAG TPA: hypothetical protein EYH34_11040 [Planctomycetes bacterium]|nr:hypothetical protein [Planctomycetota bacterium]
MEQIRMQLAITLAEEPEVWQLEGLMARAEQLKAQAQTALERGQTRLLLRRLAQAREIKRRQEALQAVEVVAERRHRQLDQLRQGEDGSPEAAAAGRFDGVGRLARVVSPKPGAPRYALVDDDGDIRCFVTPAPGVNMRFYLGKLIGVTGTRGYIAQQRAQHVVAKHITPLESRLR